MVSIDNEEKLIRLSAVPKIIQRMTGDRPHISSVHRWALRGQHGIKLRITYAAGCKRTTERWVQQYWRDVSAAKGFIGETPTRTSRQTERRIAQAERELAAMGIN